MVVMGGTCYRGLLGPRHWNPKVYGHQPRPGPDPTSPVDNSTAISTNRQANTESDVRQIRLGVCLFFKDQKGSPGKPNEHKTKGIKLLFPLVYVFLLSLVFSQVRAANPHSTDPMCHQVLKLNQIRSHFGSRARGDVLPICIACRVI